MRRTKNYKNLKFTTYFYEGDDTYFQDFAEKVIEAIKTNKKFESGNYIYEISYTFPDNSGVSYIVSRYLKTICEERINGEWFVDYETRLFYGTIVAHVEDKQ